MFTEKGVSSQTAYTILSEQDERCSAVFVQNRHCTRKGFE